MKDSLSQASKQASSKFLFFFLFPSWKQRSHEPPVTQPSARLIIVKRATLMTEAHEYWLQINADRAAPGGPKHSSRAEIKPREGKENSLWVHHTNTALQDYLGLLWEYGLSKRPYITSPKAHLLLSWLCWCYESCPDGTALRSLNSVESIGICIFTCANKALLSFSWIGGTLLLKIAILELTPRWVTKMICVWWHLIYKHQLLILHLVNSKYASYCETIQFLE